MKNRDLTFIIKVQNAASSALKALRGDFAGAGKDAADTAKSVSAAGNAFDDLAKRAKTASAAVKSATAGNVDSANQEVAAQQRVAQAYDRTAAAAQRARNSRGQFVPAGAFVVGGTSGSRTLAADATQQMRNMAFSDGGVQTAAMAAMQKEAQALRAELFPATTAYEALIAKQSRYDELLKAGAITQGEYNKATSLVKKGIADLDNVVEKHTGSVRVNSYTIRENITVLRELARGDYSRLAGTASILANQYGILGKAVEFLSNVGIANIAVMLGLAAALIAVGVAATDAEAQTNKFNSMIKLTGDYAGLTADSYRQMAERIAAATNTSISSNKDLITQLATTNKFNSDQIEGLVTAADNFARATGQKTEEVLKNWEKMAEGPGKFAMEFAQQYSGVISPTEAKMIKDLDDRGDKYGALTRLIHDLNDQLANNNDDTVSRLHRGWSRLVTDISDMWTKFTEQFNRTGIDLKISTAQNQLNDYIGHGGKDTDPEAQRLHREIAGYQAQQTNADLAATFNSARQAQQRATEESFDFVKGLGLDDPFKFKTLKDKVQAAIIQFQRIVDTGNKSDPEFEQAKYWLSHQAELIEAVKKKAMPNETRTDNALAKKSPSAILRDMGAEITSETPRSHETELRLRALAIAAGHPGDAAPVGTSYHDAAQGNRARDWKNGPTLAEAKAAYEAAGYKGVKVRTEYNGSHHIQWESGPAAAQKENAHLAEQAAQKQIDDAQAIQAFALKHTAELKAQVKEAGMLPMQSKAYAEAMKDAINAAEHGQVYDDKKINALAAQYKLLLDQKAAAEAITKLKEQNNKSEMQAYVGAQAKAGLTQEEQVSEDAKNAATLAYMGQFDTLQDALNHLGDKELQDQIATAQQWARKNFEIDKAKVGMQQLSALQDEMAKRGAARSIMGLTGYDATRAQAVQNYTFSEGAQRGLDPRTINDPAFKAKWDEVRQLAEGYGVELDKDREKQLQLEQNLGHGMGEGLKQWADQARNMSGALSQLIGNSLNQLTDSIVNFAMTGKASFGSFIHSAIQGLEQLIVKMLLLKAIQFGLNMVSPGLGDRLTAGMHHTGGTGNNHGWTGSAMAFIGAPRFHDGSGPTVADGYKRMLGLKNNEYPAILLGNERVLNPTETKAYNAGISASRAMAVGTQVTASHITYAPTNQFNFPNGAPGGGKMDEQQQQRAAAALDDHMKTQLHLWIRDEMRPGGMLYAARPQH